MVIVKEEQMELLKNIPNYEQLIAGDNPTALLDAIDEYMHDQFMFGKSAGELLEVGYPYEKLYDEVYRQNFCDDETD